MHWVGIFDEGIHQHRGFGGVIFKDSGDRNRYWSEQILSRGFELAGEYHQVQTTSFHYRSGPFLLSMNPNCREDDATFFVATIDREPFRNWDLAARVRVRDTDDADVHLFLDALADPDLLPTIVGVDWAENFLEQYLLHEQQLTGNKGDR